MSDTWLTNDGSGSWGAASARQRLTRWTWPRPILKAIADHPLRDRIYVRVTEVRALAEAAAASDRARVGASAVSLGRRADFLEGSLRHRRHRHRGRLGPAARPDARPRRCRLAERDRCRIGLLGQNPYVGTCLFWSWLQSDHGLAAFGQRSRWRGGRFFFRGRSLGCVRAGRSGHRFGYRRFCPHAVCLERSCGSENHVGAVYLWKVSCRSRPASTRSVLYAAVSRMPPFCWRFLKARNPATDLAGASMGGVRLLIPTNDIFENVREAALGGVQ